MEGQLIKYLAHNSQMDKIFKNKTVWEFWSCEQTKQKREGHLPEQETWDSRAKVGHPSQIKGVWENIGYSFKICIKIGLLATTNVLN